LKGRGPGESRVQEPPGEVSKGRWYSKKVRFRASGQKKRKRRTGQKTSGGVPIQMGLQTPLAMENVSEGASNNKLGRGQELEIPCDASGGTERSGFSVLFGREDAGLPEKREGGPSCG